VPVVVTRPKKTIVAKTPPSNSKIAINKATPVPIKRDEPVAETVAPQKDMQDVSAPVIKPKALILPPAPFMLTTRTNPLVKQIETEAGQISISLYDNGEIDGDTVSIYHNNVLLMAHARLSQKPISFSITVDAHNPHHELVMVAENLGAIPPNTSMMIITAGTKRHGVFISSNEQKNAKVVLQLKE
jgi:hypothetical protein